MRVLTRLRTISITTVIALAILGIVLLWAIRQFDNAKQNYTLADEIRINLLERIALRDQYFLYHEERLKQQWDDRLSRGFQLITLAHNQLHGPDYDDILSRIQRETNESTAIYHRITANVEAMQAAPKPSLIQEELDKRLSSQLLLKHVLIRNDISKLQELSQHQTERAYRDLILAVIGFALGLAGLILAVNWQLAQLLRRRLFSLHAGAASITAGDLSARIPVDGHDEFSDLGQAFNVMTDKLELKIQEQIRTEKDLRVAAVTFDSQQGILVTDPNGLILRVNAAFTQITGYDAGEVCGQTPRILRSGHHDASFYREMWQSVKISGTWSGEVWNRRKNGAIYPEWLTITAVMNPQGEPTHYVGMFSDITSRKEAEEKIRNLAFYDPGAGCHPYPGWQAGAPHEPCRRTGRRHHQWAAAGGARRHKADCHDAYPPGNGRPGDR